MKKYIVTLTEDEREGLRQLISKGKGAARKLLHAHILLKADTCMVEKPHRTVSSSRFAIVVVDDAA